MIYKCSIKKERRKERGEPRGVHQDNGFKQIRALLEYLSEENMDKHTEDKWRDQIPHETVGEVTQMEEETVKGKKRRIKKRGKKQRTYEIWI